MNRHQYSPNGSLKRAARSVTGDSLPVCRFTGISKALEEEGDHRGWMCIIGPRPTELQAAEKFLGTKVLRIKKCIRVGTRKIRKQILVNPAVGMEPKIDHT